MLLQSTIRLQIKYAFPDPCRIGLLAVRMRDGILISILFSDLLQFRSEIRANPSFGDPCFGRISPLGLGGERWKGGGRLGWRTEYDSL